MRRARSTLFFKSLPRAAADRAARTAQAADRAAARFGGRVGVGGGLMFRTQDI